MTLVKNDVDAYAVETKAIGPVSIGSNTDTDSATIDLASYPGWKILIVVASGTYTDGSYALKIRHSNDDSTYADATAFSGTTTAIGAANTMRTFSFVPTRRYMKVRITSTSVTTGALLTAFVILLPPTS